MSDKMREGGVVLTGAYPAEDPIRAAGGCYCRECAHAIPSWFCILNNHATNKDEFCSFGKIREKMSEESTSETDTGDFAFCLSHKVQCHIEKSGIVIYTGDEHNEFGIEKWKFHYLEKLPEFCKECPRLRKKQNEDKRQR